MTKKDYSDLESKSWVLQYRKTECPRCKNKLTID